MPLYLRIFLAFWLVILLTLGAVVLVNLQLQQDQVEAAEIGQRAQRFAAGMGARAQAVLDRGGPGALARWAQADQQRHRRLKVLVVDDDGSELLGRRLPPSARSAARDWRSGTTPAASDSQSLRAHAISHPRHGQFLVLLMPPARPLVLRLVGPLGPSGLLAIAALISGIACLLLARSVTRPIRELRRAGQALGEGRLGARVGNQLAKRGDELGDLGRDFDQMAARLERLVGSQQQLLRDVSHELRSPLTRLQMALALTERAENPHDRQRRLEQMETEIRRLDELIGQVLDFSRLRGQADLPMETIDLVALADHVVETVRPEAEAIDAALRLQAPDRLEVKGNREWLRRALENVLRNAIRHSPPDSEIDICVDRVEADHRAAIVRVADRGPGVPDDQLKAIFEPFVRLSRERSESGAGGGVGLAIALTAVKQHGGAIRAENRTAGGLRVTMTLPLCNP